MNLHTLTVVASVLLAGVAGSVSAQSLAAASEAAKKVHHEWPVSNNAGPPPPTVVELPAAAPGVAGVKDATYWKDRVDVQRSKLEDADLAEHAQFQLMDLLPKGSLAWTHALAESTRVQGVRSNAITHFIDACNEAKAAGFPQAKYDGPSHRSKETK